MLKLWGRKNSSNVKKVMWACAELRVPYERIDAGLHFGITTTDDFREKNPNGMIPVIDDDGFILWESNAIMRYLCNKHPKAPFWPENPQTRASTDRNAPRSARPSARRSCSSCAHRKRSGT